MRVALFWQREYIWRKKEQRLKLQKGQETRPVDQVHAFVWTTLLNLRETQKPTVHAPHYFRPTCRTTYRSCGTSIFLCLETMHGSCIGFWWGVKHVTMLACLAVTREVSGSCHVLASDHPRWSSPSASCCRSSMAQGIISPSSSWGLKTTCSFPSGNWKFLEYLLVWRCCGPRAKLKNKVIPLDDK